MNYIVDIDSLSILTLSIEMAIMIVSYKSFCGYYVRKDEMFAFNKQLFLIFCDLSGGISHEKEIWYFTGQRDIIGCHLRRNGLRVFLHHHRRYLGAD